MREILFRGKLLSSNDWISGYLTAEGSIDLYFVDKNTVGQFTDLTDKNGMKIFEGDIVVTRYKSGEICSIGDIQFDCGVFGAEWKCHKQNKTMIGSWGQRHNLRKLDDDIIDNIEVIGNIYDNPELLGD